MSTLKILLLVGTIIASVASIDATAIAATAHNSQTGAGTTNAYDTAASAQAKRQ